MVASVHRTRGEPSKGQPSQVPSNVPAIQDGAGLGHRPVFLDPLSLHDVSSLPDHPCRLKWWLRGRLHGGTGVQTQLDA